MFVQIQAHARGRASRAAALARRRDASARKVQRVVREWLILRAFCEAVGGSPECPRSPGGAAPWADWLRTLTPRADGSSLADALLTPAARTLLGPLEPGTEPPAGGEPPPPLLPAAPVPEPLGKENAPRGNGRPEPEPEAKAVAPVKDVLRGRRVLAIGGSMCTLSLFERDGAVRVDAAMRKDGAVLRGSAAVPDPTQDAWAVWARTEVEVGEEALCVAYR